MTIRAAWSSWVPCEKLSRNTSAPAWNSRVSTSIDALAGPRVDRNDLGTASSAQA